MRDHNSLKASVDKVEWLPAADFVCVWLRVPQAFFAFGNTFSAVRARIWHSVVQFCVVFHKAPAS